MATVKQLTNGAYSVKVSETELSLIKTALQQTERVSRLGMEVLDEADQARDGKRLENGRLRREIEALAIREASLRSLQETMAEVQRPRACVAASPVGDNLTRAGRDAIAAAVPAVPNA